MKHGPTNLAFKILPNASGSEVVGWRGEFIKIRINAPAVDGKANKALLEFLSDRVGIPKSQVTLLRGETSRQKWIAFAGIDRTALLQRLGIEESSHG